LESLLVRRVRVRDPGATYLGASVQPRPLLHGLAGPDACGEIGDVSFATAPIITEHAMHTFGGRCLTSHYTYLLRNAEITRPNHVWAADITYIPMQRGFVYLFAVLDWASRRVLAWRLSNTLTTDFCLEAVQEALTSSGTPEIFNTDQGCQFTSQEFTGLLHHHGIQISMDGTGCWRDNVFVERLWKTIKYEEVYLHAYETVSAAQPSRG